MPPPFGLTKKTRTRIKTTNSMCDCGSLATLHGGLRLLLHDLWTCTLGGCCCRKSKGHTKIDTHTHTRSLLHMCVYIHKYICMYLHTHPHALIIFPWQLLFFTPLLLAPFLVLLTHITHTHIHTCVCKICIYLILTCFRQNVAILVLPDWFK